MPQNHTGRWSWRQLTRRVHAGVTFLLKCAAVPLFQVIGNLGVADIDSRLEAGKLMNVSGFLDSLLHQTNSGSNSVCNFVTSGTTLTYFNRSALPSQEQIIDGIVYAFQELQLVNRCASGGGSTVGANAAKLLAATIVH